MNEESASYCRHKAREHDPDAYLAALFAAEPQRRDLWALQAFVAELARVPQLVSEPMLGEIRMQWWREALERLFAGRTEPHPVIEALVDALLRTPFALKPFERLIEAYTLELHPASIARAETLALYLGATGSDLLALAAGVLDAASAPDDAVMSITGAGGPALGLARLLRRLPVQAAQGRIPLSTELLAGLSARAGEACASLDAMRGGFRALGRPRLLPAFLPLSVIRPILAAAARPGFDPLRPSAERPLYRRQLRMIGAMIRGDV